MIIPAEKKTSTISEVKVDDVRKNNFYFRILLETGCIWKKFILELVVIPTLFLRLNSTSLTTTTIV